MTSPTVVHIIDDDLSVLASTAMLLKLLGPNVVAWSSPFDFLEKAALEKDHVVLLDLRMPDLDGLMVFRKLRTDKFTNAVILMTGHGDSALEAEALALGFSAILHKPFSEVELVAAIEGAKVSEPR